MDYPKLISEKWNLTAKFNCLQAIYLYAPSALAVPMLCVADREVKRDLFSPSLRNSFDKPGLPEEKNNYRFDIMFNSLRKIIYIYVRYVSFTTQIYT